MNQFTRGRGEDAHVRAALADAARQSFVSGMDLGLLIAATVVAAAACLILLALPQRPGSPGQ